MSSTQNEPDLANITSLNEQLLDPQTKEPLHRYFHATWRHQYPPYGYVVFYLESYDVRKKTFSIRVLSDGRVLNYIPLDYPCVKITEAEAQTMIEHRRGSQTTNQQQTNMANTDTPATEKKTKAPKTTADGRTPIRQLALQGFASGASQDDIVAGIKALYPEKEEKKIRQLVSLYRWNEKAKAKKADAAPADAAPADAAPADAAPADAAPADAAPADAAPADAAPAQ